MLTYVNIQLRCFKTTFCERSANVFNVLERSLFENFRNVSDLFFFIHNFISYIKKIKMLFNISHYDTGGRPNFTPGR